LPNYLLVKQAEESGASHAANLFDLRLETRFGKNKYRDLYVPRSVDSAYALNRNVNFLYRDFQLHVAKKIKKNM
jgi:hypothetical protein